MSALLADLEQESLRTIAKRVADGFGLDLADLRQFNPASRAARVREARAIVCWLADKTTMLQASQVARFLAVPDKSVYDWTAQIEAKASTTPAYMAMLLSMAPDDFARRLRVVAIVNNAEAARRSIKRALETDLAVFEHRLAECLNHDAVLTLGVLLGALDGIQPSQASRAKAAQK